MRRLIEFTKMHGAGNDYIYVNDNVWHIENPEQLSVRLSKPHTGIGSDGLILIGSSDVADCKMRIFNADGSEALMCGNGVRCVGKYVYDKGLVHNDTITVETLSGIKTVSLHFNKEGQVDSASVDMGSSQLICLNGETEPFVNKEISAGDITMKATAVSMGNPHLVFFVDNAETINVAEIGPVYEKHPWFPQRTNVEFASIISPSKIRMRVWERGSGITMACGTGACATFVAAEALGTVKGKTAIVLDGGVLEIERTSSGHIMMTGPAETVYEGKIFI